MPDPALVPSIAQAAAAPPPSVASRLVGLIGGGLGAAASLPFKIPQALVAGIDASQQRRALEMEAARLENERAAQQVRLGAAQLPAQEGLAAAQTRQYGAIDARLASETDPDMRESLIRGAATGEYRPFRVEPGPAELASTQMVLGMTRDQANAALQAHYARLQAQLEAKLQRETTRLRLGGELDLERQKRGLGPEPVSASDVAGMRKEFVSGSADFEVIRDSVAKLQTAATNPSPAGDMSLIFAYMKLLDPKSTVREGERADAQNAASVPERIRQQYNKARTGEGLTEEIRGDYLQQGLALYKTQEGIQSKRKQLYDELAARRGVDPRDVTGVVPSLPQQPSAPARRVRVSNGAESYEIDEADLKEAEADGFRAVP